MSPLTLSLVLASQSIPFYIGTYTSPNGSQGIYEARLNMRTGAISKPVLAIRTENPSYLAVHPNGRCLYSVDESDHGSANAFLIGSGHRLKLIDSQKVRGQAPTYVSVDPRGKFVLTASYVGGVLSCLPIGRHGALLPVSSEIVNAGSGPNKERQEGSHMHFALTDSRSRYAYSCDLGTDKVQRYRLRRVHLSRVGRSDAMALPGSGPRHGAFGRRGRFLYVCNEMGCTVCTFSVNRHNGALRRLQTLSTLTANHPLPGATTAEIAVHPTGRTLYISNRGDDSVAVFRVRHNGLLKRIQVKKLPVQTPRGFGIDPTGRWLIACGQSDDRLVAVQIGRRTGRLGHVGPTIGAPTPVCIAWPRR